MKTELLTVRGMGTRVARCGNENLPPLVMLHGFTGSVAGWKETIEELLDDYHVVAIDLIGHGKTAAPETAERYRMEEQIADLHEVLQQLGIKKPVLLGYSMGGRVALGYAVTYPQEVACLILESSSPGLRTEEERSTRRIADAKLADRIMNEGMDGFVDFWQAIPLFDSQRRLPKAKRQAIRDERVNQRPAGLANSLLGIGTGSQPSYWEKLDRFTSPVLLITGSLDTKFETIARQMAKSAPNVRHETILDAGHAIHVEKPRLFATMIKSFLNKCKE